MNNGRCLQITCPVDKVISAINNASIVNGVNPNVIKLEYGDDSPDVEPKINGWEQIIA